MYFCDYFLLSNGPNLNVICIIPIFEVILVKILVFEPPGRIYIGVTPTGLQLFSNKYHQALSLLITLYHQMVQIGK